jgi:gamma-glutamyltranspeptidase/glutathione hydrolase
MPTYRPSITGSRHMVSAGHYSAAHAAFQILEAGGNAIDAGVAAGMALGILQTDRVNFAGVAPIMIYLGAGADPRQPCYALGV